MVGQNGKKGIAVAVAIVADAGRVLIARRVPDGPLGGFWEFPGGKIETGESAAQAAVREVQEELGLAVTAIDAWPAIAHSYAHADVQLTPVICRRRFGEPRAIACAEWNWASADQLPAYAFPAANRQLTLNVAQWLRLQTPG